MSCPACFSGHIDSSKPIGRVEIVHGRETYVAEPPEGELAKGIVVIIPDAFGQPFVNNQILADHYAAGGKFRVYLPDFTNGTSTPAETLNVMNRFLDSNESWLWKPWYMAQILVSVLPFVFSNRFNVAWPKITSFLQSIRSTEEGARLPISVAGFCWGGPFVVKLASNSRETRTLDGKQPLVDAFFTAHPSNLSIPADIQQIKTNISIASGDQDFVLNMKQIEQVKATLAKMDNVDSEFVLYPGAGHGFAVRADKKSNLKVAEQAEEAEKQAIAWFQKQFSKVKY